jgi:hypothetical protein
MRPSRWIVLDAPCPSCGKPLTTPRLTPKDRYALPAARETVLLCVMCVARVLVQATLALHGPPSPHAESRRCPGHDERMRAHAERVARELEERHA